jgi:NTP pyrophosphatase (non-canonical NTP hydrolase)
LSLEALPAKDHVHAAEVERRGLTHNGARHPLWRHRQKVRRRTIGMDDAWGTIEEIVEWLDGGSTLGPEIKKLIRIMKLTEEAGEVTQAVIGTLGQNPRKGVTHTWEDVQAELCDVIVTAMVALTTLTPDARETFDGHLARVASRSLGTPSAATAS